MGNRITTPARMAIWFLLAAFAALILASATAPAAAAEAAAPAATTLEKCEKGVANPDGSTRTYRDYALCMAAELELAQAAFGDGDVEGALDQVGEAYFGWYENNLEPASMTLPGNRKVTMEGRFTRLKIAIRGGADGATVHEDIETLKTAVARDAMVLDGVLDSDAPESAGLALFEGGPQEEADSSALRWIDFTTAFTLLLREGLEALLVVAAIVLYLVKTGNKSLVKAVFLGVAAGVGVSFLLAWALHALTGGAGRASELFEGLTMFLAVAMLFYVSNWMLSKASGENWQKYISGMVEASVSRGAARAIVFVAFLAVVREGAELVLFYTAAFSSGGHDRMAIAGGFLAAAVVLAIVYVVFRYGGAKLPIGPIFYATSILLFAMCLSFVGKGVAELKEADFILGDTNLPWMTHYLPELGIYPWAETLLPQIILLIAAVWIIWAHARTNRRSRVDAASAPNQETLHEAHE